jgi:hypothetical protein
VHFPAQQISLSLSLFKDRKKFVCCKLILSPSFLLYFYFTCITFIFFPHNFKKHTHKHHTHSTSVADHIVTNVGNKYSYSTSPVEWWKFNYPAAATIEIDMSETARLNQIASISQLSSLSEGRQVKFFQDALFGSRCSEQRNVSGDDQETTDWL